MNFPHFRKAETKKWKAVNWWCWSDSGPASIRPNGFRKLRGAETRARDHLNTYIFTRGPGGSGDINECSFFMNLRCLQIFLSIFLISSMLDNYGKMLEKQTITHLCQQLCFVKDLARKLK